MASGGITGSPCSARFWLLHQRLARFRGSPMRIRGSTRWVALRCRRFVSPAGQTVQEGHQGHFFVTVEEQRSNQRREIRSGPLGGGRI